MFIQKCTGLLSLLLFIPLTGCGDDAFPKTGPAVMISQHGAKISHTDGRRGQNCLNCHTDGDNDYVFTVAGTVYQFSDPTAVYPNATISFYSESGGAGSLIETVDVNGNGNFYTTRVVDFSAGVFPSIVGASIGEGPVDMGDSTILGECNGCHGISQLPITIGLLTNR